MSLAALLNKEDESPLRDSITNESPRTRFVGQLNEKFRAIATRDIREHQSQDWKMLNYQEFELLSEWNTQIRELGSNNFQLLLNNIDRNNKEYQNYQEYQKNKRQVYREQQEKLKAQVSQKKKKRTNIKKESNHKLQDHATDTDADLTQDDEANTEDEDNPQQHQSEDEEVEEDEIPDVVFDNEEEVGFIDDDTDDKDFSLDDERALAKNKKGGISSERTMIRREIAKMVNKNKNAKIKKRRFTNATITDYDPMEEKLELKITLKQFHVRQLKKLITESKRPLDDETAENSNKRKKPGPKPRSLGPNVSVDGLPTYGMKMTAKEARAIQRHYDNTYFMIWKDMSRKDSAKMARLVQQIQSTRAVNFKKTSSLVAREARKWQARNFKQVKDMQTRARRGVREMSSFWKKNEREERELKKKAEKEALEQAKREEEERENKRQARKLNFLLTQTELYSHFIGRKIKTDELEGSMADSSLKQKQQSQTNVDLSTTEATKNDVHSIDFENEDDAELQRKAAQNASSALMETQAKAKAFDHNPDEEEELNFQNPTSLGDITVAQPKMLACTLKEYQLKGLNWLANLYDQGINGILADEMGLGKTVQSISVLANLAERYNIWGPFIVVTPASTLHNWVNEIAKFVPDFKILPYWGNGSDRKVLRKFWDRKHLRYGKDAPFHVMITSYQMVVSDAAYLQKMKWQYMILDEAQAIKSSQSSRWKNLLSFHCRNRLLLTGTPIQNSMQELWALLHFIMPSLFDSHDEFSDWFSKDIESHAQSNTQLNQQQLRRLHMILKPFMLRRIKKNVQSELGDKIEIDVMCDLTHRQSKLYKVLKSQVTAYDAIENAACNDDVTSDQNLVNTVMQFRKVCNHPDLFERADVSSPFLFGEFGRTGSLSREGDLVDVMYSTKNPITFNLPRLVYDDLILPSYNNELSIRANLLYHTLNILHPANSFQLCQFLSKLTGLPPNEFNRLSQKPIVKRAIELDSKGENFVNALPIIYDENEDLSDLQKSLLFGDRLEQLNLLSKTTTKGILDSLLNIKQNVYDREYMNLMSPAYHATASAPPINIEVLSSMNFANKKRLELFEPEVSQALGAIPPIIQYNLHVTKGIPLSELPKSELLPQPFNKQFSSSCISMPSMDRFITESAKLKKLDELLVKLKKDGHRVLIYFQMTRMMDLMEEYLTYKQYNHIRLDGSSKLEDRRDLVHDWQTKPEIFIFLLSTRAGGLGINLTAADTVIFYDSDWNPTIDSQAMDRAHRLGQTKQVTVYRLLIRGTIEERMRDRAKQKEHVQQVVMEGKTQEKNIQTVEANGNGPVKQGTEGHEAEVNGKNRVS